MKFFYRTIIEKLTSLNISKSLLSSRVEMVENTRTKTTFETLNFDNQTLRTLPIDPITENYVRQVKNAMFSRVSESFLFHSSIILKL